MAKKTTAASDAAPSKSQIVRDYIKDHPSETPKKIEAGLKAQGKDVSAALIAKIKYDKGRKKKGKKSKVKGTGSAVAAGVNKSESIRQAFRLLGKNARSKDIVAHLEGQGVTVASAQVSMVRAKLKDKAMARKSGRMAATSSGDSVALSSLFAAKQLADQLGGVEAAKLLLDTLAKLS